ncbi:MAG: (Fe-S)-binding protein [Promethearchaeota archaeon]|nr:MAG: (Fe-S)-binding protein [Candidatus Lokiarchaeota archaeon]
MKNIDYNFKKEKKKIIPLMRKFAERCTACGLCVEHCVFHDYSRKDGRQIMKELKEFVLSKNLDSKLSKKTRKFIWSCGICEHCNNWCPLPDDKKIPRSPMIVLLRGILVIKNDAPLIIRFVRRFIFKTFDNPILKEVWPLAAKILVPNWYENSKTQITERKEIEKARLYPKKGADICFFGGCGHTFAMPDTVYSITSILKEAKDDYITIGNPAFCCGVIYIILGYLTLWLEQTHSVMKNYLELEPSPKKIILHCPGCYTIYNFDLSNYGLILPLSYLKIMDEPIEFLHITEYILELLKEKKIELKKELPMRIVYNDNCSLGRRRKGIGEPIYEQPREVLRKIPGIEMIELEDNRDDSYCCGLIATKTQGMGKDLHIIHKDKAYKIQKEIYQEMIDKDTDNLVTPCMGCGLIFEDSSRFWSHKLGKKINIIDFAGLINESMGKKVPNRNFSINNIFQLSMPFIKLTALKLIPRMIKTYAFKDIINLIRKSFLYLLK